MYFLTYLIAFILSAQISGATVRFNSVSDIQMSAGKNTSSLFTVITDEPADGAGTTDSDPAVVYIPYNNSVAGDDTQKFVTIDSASNLPSKGEGSSLLRVYLDADNTDSAGQYLYAAIQDSGSSYKIVSSYYDLGGSVSTSGITHDLDFTDICVNGLGADGCSALDTLSSGTAQKDFLLYFFLSSSSTYTVNNAVTVDSSTNTGGVFLTVKLFAQHTAPQTVAISELRKGDGRLTAVYTGTTYDNHYRTLAVTKNTVSGNLSLASNQGVQDTGFDELIDMKTIASSGYGTIRNLENGTTYDVAVIFENKYQISTAVETSKQQTPEEIEALLEKQSCFFLTAGFGGEHFLIDGYRWFRDHILMRVWWGKFAVRGYYSFAEKRAMLVYQSSILAAIFRFLAYFWPIALMAIMALFAGGLLGLIPQKAKR